MVNLKPLRKLSLKDYMEWEGSTFIDAPNYWRTSSPFSSDTTPSFVVYKDNNKFYCFSTGKKGDLFDYVMLAHELTFPDTVEHLEKYRTTTDAQPFTPLSRNYVPLSSRKSFDINKYINHNDVEIEQIAEYARSRGIVDGYRPGIVFDPSADYGDFERVPAMLFEHRDESLKICGAKFRRLHGSRFTARGKLNWYILSNLKVNSSFQKPVLYIMESETSANSLWEYLKHLNKPGVVLCFGGVSSQPPKIPYAYENIEDRRLIIDYDGDEELYQMRIKRFNELQAKPVKMILDKGEDINSLYADGRVDLIYNLIN